jgi:hypothetical protein
MIFYFKNQKKIISKRYVIRFNCIFLHQERKICFWLSFASDVQMLDRTEQESIQYTKNGTDGAQSFERLIQKVREILPEDRSSFDELPVEFPELLFSHGEKIEWLKQVF